VIGGIQPCSWIDFPGHLAAVVFFQGCDLSCPYCQNPHLIARGTLGDPSKTALDFLAKRKGLLTGVVFSGGEPTLEPSLSTLLGDIKGLGFATKLDTNGQNPEVLKDLLSLLDYVAVDVKVSSQSSFGKFLGKTFDGQLPLASLTQVSPYVRCEARTTLIGEWHSEEELALMAGEISRTGAKSWFLQKYRGTRFSDVPDSVIQVTLEVAQKLGLTCRIR
jgi:pyruvate formate lyase activating enzyme